ncbi:hypothetical protein [Silvanigrella aquatica]|uniref:Uncharacterized protein n=1 Tax=Silvanigrella aquatica TaxID=1915309 RepID=A0A1L4D0U8_9BACT|nr:hypothetical protein [Silvanigrella aquatica]APJ03842.1 hypothetical protein AXG55_07960 [Silvanigrella aquatica]
MGLMKLWQQPKQEISNIEVPHKSKGELFFSSLQNQLEKDLLFIRSQKDLGKEFFFSQVKISHGLISPKANTKDKDFKDGKSYLFMHIPGEAGFLIEPNINFELFHMYRASKVHQHLGNGNLDTPPAPFFILKSKSISEFKLIDENYVRVVENGKTLSVAQMSEMLLLLADSIK